MKSKKCVNIMTTANKINSKSLKYHNDIRQ